jgi:hypothetical protein
MGSIPDGLARPRRTVSRGIVGLLLVGGLATLAGCSGGSPKPTPTPTVQAGVPMSVTIQAPSQPQPADTPPSGAYPAVTVPTSEPYPAPTP